MPSSEAVNTDLRKIPMQCRLKNTSGSLKITNKIRAAAKLTVCF